MSDHAHGNDPASIRVQLIDAHYLDFAGRLARQADLADEDFFHLLAVVAEAAVSHDQQTLVTAFRTLKSLREQLPPDPELDEWRGRLRAAQVFCWLAHSCIGDELL
jgi:hypothetical protein